MISLCAPTYDINGCLLLKETTGNKLADISRRVTRVATLDGGAVIPDYGYSTADRTFNLAVTVNENQLQSLQRLVKYYPLLICCCSEGAFIGAVSNVTVSKTEARITYLVKEEVS